MGTIVPHVEPQSRRESPEPRPAVGAFAGLATLDVVQSVERMPAPNEKVVAPDFLVAAGGPAANAAVAFAHCGGTPALITVLPDHPLADVIEADLTASRVSTVRAASYEGVPITASILVTRGTGERAVVSPLAAADDGDLTPTPGSAFADADAPPPPLDGVGVVLLDGYFRSVCLVLAREARRVGVPVLFDGGSFKPHTDEVLAHVDVAIVSADFAPTGTAGDADAVRAYLAGRGVERVVITRGAGSVLWWVPGASGEVLPPPVTPVDTLGAGDFFHGALAWRVAALGWDDARLAEDIAFACGVAARSVKSFGTRAWLDA